MALFPHPHAIPGAARPDFDEARDAELRRFMRAVSRRRSAYEDDLELRPNRGDHDVSTAQDLAFD